MPTRFDRDTAVTPVGEGVFEACIDHGWWIVRGPNGGYVAALLMRALEASVGDASRAARSLTVHYLRPPAEGPARIETRVLRQGRSLSSVAAHLLQDGKLQATALAAFSKHREALAFQHLVAPSVPPPEEIAAPPPTPSPIPFRERFVDRPALGPAPGEQGQVAEVGGWLRLAEPHPLDAPALALLADAWRPAIFSLSGPEGGSRGVPTIDLTVHFRAPLPPPGPLADDWVLVRFRTTTARDGFIEEDGEIWSRDGTLLAQARQLAVLA